MKIGKIAAVLLAAACTFASACAPANAGGTNNGPVTGGVVTEPNNTIGYVEGTLHNVNVDFNSPASESFVKNGETQYKILYGGIKSSRAASYIGTNVATATGARLEITEIAEDSEVDLNDANASYILVGCEDLFVQAGGEVPTYETIGVSGYQVKTVGKNVFINAYTENGYQMGVLAFLREVLGYDMFMEDLVIYEKDGSVMPAMDIVERPDFDYRQNGGALTNAENYGMGFTYTSVWISPANVSFCHNWSAFVTAEEAEEHPNWVSIDPKHAQGCYTSRGDKETFKGLVNHLTEKLKKFLKANPNVDNIMIAQHDTSTDQPVDNCVCPACKASYQYYGNTMAGAWLSLCNRVSLQVDQWLQTEEAKAIFGGVKEFNLGHLTYHNEVGAPAEKNASGNYKLDENGKGIPMEEMWFNSDGSMEDWDDAWDGSDEESTETSEVVTNFTQETERLYCAPSVQIVWATSGADWVNVYYGDSNKSWADMAVAWSGFGGDFYVWAYSLNSQGIFYPYNSFDTFFESTKFFKSFGAKWIFWQGNYQNPKNGGFEKLKRYLESKVEFDVNADYQHYVDKWFKYVYGSGGEYMQQYFEEVLLQCRYVEKVNNVSGQIHNKKLIYAENWPLGLMNKWLGLIEKAYVAIEEDYKVSDPEMYQVYHDHILMEEFFPTYVCITSYEDAYKPSVLKEMRKEFIREFTGLGNNYYGEGRLLVDVTSTWDLD